MNGSGNVVSGCTRKDEKLHALEVNMRFLALKKNLARWLYTSDPPFQLRRIERLSFDGYEAAGLNQSNLGKHNGHKRRRRRRTTLELTGS